TPSMVPLAAQAIAVGVSANAVTKLVVALVLGGPRYRAQAALGLGALLTAGAVTIVLLAR
ncbi:MAG TPA: hypothetical protein PKH96_22255, partial [Gemmatimonadaceae bacterium]|nr:hypothetical protein [Gemmatimonadaceae bacterium]